MVKIFSSYDTEQDLFILSFLPQSSAMLVSKTKSKLLSERLITLVEQGLAERGVSARQASLDVVGHDGLIRDIRAGRMPSADRVVALFEYFGMEAYFGPVRVDPIAPEIKIADSEFAAIAVQSAYASAGPGSVNIEQDPIGELAFRRSWLTAMGINPGRSVIVRVRGTSMEPTIKDGSIALIDEQRSDLKDGKVYAFVEGDELRIKRLQIDQGRSIALISDNRDFPVEFRTGVDMNALRPLGEVVWTAYNWLEDGKGVLA